MRRLTHTDEKGRARMVDVSEKPTTTRTATGEGRLSCLPTTLAAVREGAAPKGAVIGTAEMAGIMGAKRTADLIPLCHPLSLTKVVLTIEIVDETPGFLVRSEVKTSGATGVEMEALTAVSIACLTLFDMLKAVDRTMEISGIRVVTKEGGQSGSWGSP